MKKIVILDSAVADGHGAIKWDALSSIGELEVYPRMPQDEVSDRVRDAWAILTNKVVIDASLLDNMPDLKYIGVLATGFNNIDTDAADRHGVTVTNVPAYSTDSVVQLTWALILECVNSAGEYSRSVSAGDWAGCRDFSYLLRPYGELAGKTLGVVGFGNIGSRVAEVGHAFGMRVITTSRNELPSWARRVDKDTLLGESDVISLNTALTPATRNYINRDSIAKMKRGVIIANTSRGPVIDEDALAEALRNGHVAGAGLDVLVNEPPRDGSPLIGCPGAIITPHIAWQSTEARERLVRIAIDNLLAFDSGKSVNVVNQPE